MLKDMLRHQQALRMQTSELAIVDSSLPLPAPDHTAGASATPQRYMTMCIV